MPAYSSRVQPLPRLMRHPLPSFCHSPLSSRPCPRSSWLRHSQLRPRRDRSQRVLPSHLRDLQSDDTGMVTVEAALALVSLMVVLVMCLAGVGAGLTQLRLADAAHTVARSVSRGGTPPDAAALQLPATAQIHISTRRGVAHVQVDAPAPLLPLRLHAGASMPLEKVAE